MKFGILLMATAAAMLVTAACRTTPNSVAAASQAPIPTTVGPVPGGVSEVKPRMNPYTGNPSLCRRVCGFSTGTTAQAVTVVMRAEAWDQAFETRCGSTAIATTRSLTRSHRGAPRVCPPGEPRSPRTRFGNWLPTSNPCGHPRSRIRPLNQRMRTWVPPPAASRTPLKRRLRRTRSRAD